MLGGRIWGPTARGGHLGIGVVSGAIGLAPFPCVVTVVLSSLAVITAPLVYTASRVLGRALFFTLNPNCIKSNQNFSFFIVQFGFGFTYENFCIQYRNGFFV